MKFSVLIQYYNRRDLLINTIDSIRKSSLINDCEIIITDDASDDIHKIDDINLIYPDLDIKIFSFKKEDKWWSCPVLPINKGIAEASGDIIILQGAECYHNGDILLDAQNRIKSNDYLVYGAFSLDPSDNPIDFLGIESPSGEWYQHSIYKNMCWNFCCAINRDDLIDLGGFDERYAHGMICGDSDFILRIRRKGMNVISVDNPYILHQYHDPVQQWPESKRLRDRPLYDIVVNYGVGYRVKNSFLINKSTFLPKYNNILLINPWEGEVFPPPSIGYLQSSIKHILGDSVKVTAADLKDALELLKYEDYDLVGVSFHSFSVKYAKLIKDSIRESTHLICGGHHPSSLPQQMIDIGYDQVVIGEGENSIIDIILGKEESKFVYDKKSYFKSIDDIPFPDYTGLSGEWKNTNSSNGYPIISSRGCPFTCNFCASSIFWNRKIHMRTPESVVSEIIYNIENYGMNNWMFEDDNFTLNKNRAIEICKGIIEINNKYGKRNWQCASRAESLDEELCSILFEAGCTTIWVGVESFSQDSLNRCSKHTTVEKMVRGIEIAESIGIQTMCQFIVGLPGDTIDDIIKTVDVIKTTKMSRFGGNIAWILPSTNIYNKAKQFGFSDKVYLESGNIFYTYEQDIDTLNLWVSMINNAKN